MTFLTPRTPKITRAEMHLRKALENEKIRFISQEVIRCQGGHRHYCVDFQLIQEPIIIEVDGASHDHASQQIRDERKTKDLEAEGYKVLRFRDDQVWNDLKTVIKTIKTALNPTNPKNAPTAEKPNQSN